jgi:hypothetical protein
MRLGTGGNEHSSGDLNPAGLVANLLKASWMSDVAGRIGLQPGWQRLCRGGCGKGKSE